LDHGDDDARHNLGVHLLEVGRVDEGLDLIRAAADRGDKLAAEYLRELLDQDDEGNR